MGPFRHQNMEITRASDYAVRVLIHLAALPAGSMAQAATLAEATGVNEQFLSKVLQRLVRSGLTRSQRGSGGGFGLAVHPDRVSLLDVVQAIEGPLRLNQCLFEGPSCDRKSWCPAHGVWRDAQDALVNVLGSVSMAQLAAKVPSGSENQYRFHHGLGRSSDPRNKKNAAIPWGVVR